VLNNFRCLIEHADEVRDRAAIYLQIIDLESGKKSSMTDLAFGEGNINVSALENYLKENKDSILSNEKALQIDLTKLKQEEAPKVTAAKREEFEELKALPQKEVKKTVESTTFATGSKERHVEAFMKSSIYENFSDPAYIAPKVVSHTIDISNLDIN
jgi:predicted transcriptional regulator